MENYVIESLLGKGGFGTVFKIKEKNNKQSQKKFFALKVLSNYFDRSTEDTFEKTILEELNHPFIVKLISNFRFKRDFCLVLEYISGGTLADLINEKGKFTEEVAGFYLKEIVMAVQHLHDMSIMHRDLKPNNILIDEEGHIKLTDFGASCRMEKCCLATGIVGTKFFMAPEVFRNVYYTKEVDWWSVGLIFYIMMIGYHPYKLNAGEHLLQFYLSNKHIRGISPIVSENARDILTSLLCLNPKKRLGNRKVGRVQEHAYFKNTDWFDVFNKCDRPPLVPLVKEQILTAKEKLKFIYESSTGCRYKKHFGLIGFIGNKNMCVIS